MTDSRQLVRWLLILVGVYAFYKLFLEDKKESSTFGLVGSVDPQPDEEEQEEPQPQKVLVAKPYPMIANRGSRALEARVLGGNGQQTLASQFRKCSGGYSGLNPNASGIPSRGTNSNPATQ